MEIPYSCPYLHQILAEFKNSFTGTLSRKFAVKPSLKNITHLKHIASLLYAILMSENRVSCTFSNYLAER